jgi:hypothetical protein
MARAVLPWEEPGTGEGSPLATLISVGFPIVPAVIYSTCAVILSTILDRPRDGPGWLEIHEPNRADISDPERRNPPAHEKSFRASSRP